MYTTTYTTTFYTSTQPAVTVTDAPLHAETNRWYKQQALQQHTQQEEYKIKKTVQCKKLFQAEMLQTSNVKMKATFAPAYYDAKNDDLIYQSYAEVLHGELDYAHMNILVTQLILQQAKAGNVLAQKILVKASQTFAANALSTAD